MINTSIISVDFNFPPFHVHILGCRLIQFCFVLLQIRMLTSPSSTIWNRSRFASESSRAELCKRNANFNTFPLFSPGVFRMNPSEFSNRHKITMLQKTRLPFQESKKDKWGNNPFHFSFQTGLSFIGSKVSLFSDVFFLPRIFSASPSSNQCPLAHSSEFRS